MDFINKKRLTIIGNVVGTLCESLHRQLSRCNSSICIYRIGAGTSGIHFMPALFYAPMEDIPRIAQETMPEAGLKEPLVRILLIKNNNKSETICGIKTAHKQKG